MIKYYRKISIFNVCETWFNYQYTSSDKFKLKVLKHLKDDVKRKIPGIKEISHSVEIDLEQDISIILANFSSDLRRKIRKAESEDITCYFNNDFEKFVSFFNDFATKKKTFITSKNKMMEFGNYLKISCAEHNGEWLAAHSYLVDEDMKIAMGMHSGTIRLQKDTDKSLVGRAHKLLVLKDILYFKEKGFKVFDFGGYAYNTNDTSLKGINEFKLSFGGKVVPCINYYSYSYWIFKKISKILGVAGRL